MRLPRDLNASDLIKALKIYGYEPTRQVGSHILPTERKGVHHITIPNHDPIKVGTLSAILNDVASHLSTNKEELIRALWG